LKYQNTIRNICIGLVDGLTIPLALAAGLSSIAKESTTIVIACLATALAGSLTMTFGGYMEGKKYTSSRRPFNSALVIGLGYLAGGAIIIIPYMLIQHPPEAMPYAILIALPVLFAAGYLDSNLNGANGWTGAFRVMITGGLATLAAVLIARLFI
jgi:VIT1/CCC1 family predicted Fe2+/Mn2+ transporter